LLDVLLTLYDKEYGNINQKTKMIQLHALVGSTCRFQISPLIRGAMHMWLPLLTRGALNEVPYAADYAADMLQIAAAYAALRARMDLELSL
jgi:hypothetical protein